MKLRVGLLASHRGTNVQAVVKAVNEGRLEVAPAVIISNNRDSVVLEFARAQGIPGVWIGGAEYEDEGRRDLAICEELVRRDIGLVLLLGYMKKLGPVTLARFRNRILNIHPALLPKHGGQGRFGIHVHESVLESGDKETGVSIHMVDDLYDHGRVIAQCRVAVEPGDTAKTLQARVLEREQTFIVETLRGIVEGKIELG
jgi:phosphoribosylglycinamide formyltransferase-1